MLKANFSEYQLQASINAAIAIHLGRQFSNDPPIMPIVPSLLAEAALGWDTAFSIPWLPYELSANHEHCNFFLQYKLSKKLASRNAKQWKHWKKKYFRFEIPHAVNVSDPSQDDYDQWTCLKKLADAGYPTFYATNSTICKNQLHQDFQQNNLLDKTPFLDVRDVKDRHRHVTFTEDSQIFKLHSELEEVTKTSSEALISKLREARSAPIEELNRTLLKDLRALRETDLWRADLDEIQRLSERYLREFPFPPQIILPWIEQMLLAGFVRKHIGVVMLLR